jgi:magnesium chelatase family protein
MLAKVLSSAVYGLAAYQVDVEVDIATGLPQFNIVGLPDLAVKESKDRVRAALKNTGFNFPIKRITVNLAPADIKKEGSAFDLPMAIGILVAEEVIPHSAVSSYLIVGELSLDGKIKPVKGALSITAAARAAGFKGIILPSENAAEGGGCEGVQVYGVRLFLRLLEFINGQEGSVTRVDEREIFAENSVYSRTAG